MTTQRRSSLTGSWSGAYRYPNDEMPSVTFSAHLNEADGKLIGLTHEPNVLSIMPFDAFLAADLEGGRSGQEVRFSKSYRHPALQKDVLSYEGVANETLTRIEGSWTIPGSLSGTFFMTHDDAPTADPSPK